MKKFFDCILKNKLKDVLVSGFVESNTSRNFVAMFRYIYFYFDDAIFEMKSDFHFTLKQIKKITPHFEVEFDDEFCISSIYFQCFATEDPLKFSSIVYYFDASCTEKLFFFELTYFVGEVQKTIYFNPKNINGVEIFHNEAARDIWLEEISELGIDVLKNELCTNGCD